MRRHRVLTIWALTLALSTAVLPPAAFAAEPYLDAYLGVSTWADGASTVVTCDAYRAYCREVVGELAALVVRAVADGVVVVSDLQPPAYGINLAAIGRAARAAASGAAVILTIRAGARLTVSALALVPVGGAAAVTDADAATASDPDTAAVTITRVFAVGYGEGEMRNSPSIQVMIERAAADAARSAVRSAGRRSDEPDCAAQPAVSSSDGGELEFWCSY